jgi:phosphoribosylglycinamide formyltransferase-1
MYKLGWFSTGRDKAARDLLEAVQSNIKSGKIKAQIAFVFSNRESGEAEESDRLFKMVADCKIPLICFSYEKFRAGQGKLGTHTGTLPSWRLDYDREVMERIKDIHPDLCVLAGYMLIVGKEMCQRYNMINLHPAAPGGPTGTWQEVIWQLIEKEAETSGVMMHLVTPELDKGPPVAYCTYSIRGEPFDRHWRELEMLPTNHSRSHDERNSLFRLIRQHGLAREFPLIIATLNAFSQDKIRISPEKQVVDAEGKPIKGYNMTDEINELIRG